MKIAIVTFANLKITPYIKAYTAILNKLGMDFDIIMWDRRHIDESFDCNKIYKYPKYMDEGSNKIIKLWHMRNYAKYVKKVLDKNQYDRVLVLSSLLSVFMKSYLVKKLKGKYILDIRDHSYEHIKWYYNQLDAVMANSRLNVISSYGFRAFLPKRDTIWNHNNNDTEIILSEADIQPGKKINISFIGNIRYFSAYKDFMLKIKNHPRISLSFHGYGPEEPLMKEFCKENGIDNVYFHGEYKPDEKIGFLKESDVIFNVYGTDLHVKYLMSNRYYDALYFKKPLLVNKDTTMAEMSKGIAFEYTDDSTVEELLEWYDNIDSDNLCKLCTEKIEQVIKDNEDFEAAVIDALRGGTH